jgi:hypothetical protein
LPARDAQLSDDQRVLQSKLMNDLDLTELQSKKIALKVSPKEVHKTIFDIKATARSGKIKTNIAAYAMGVFSAKYEL